MKTPLQRSIAFCKIEPRNQYAWRSNGWALGKLGRDEEALSSYDRALELDADDNIAWEYKAAALSKLGRDNEAATAYKSLLEIEPYDIRAWIALGAALVKLCRHEEAAVAYDRVLQIDPDNLDARAGKARLVNRHNHTNSGHSRSVKDASLQKDMPTGLQEAPKRASWLRRFLFVEGPEKKNDIRP